MILTNLVVLAVSMSTNPGPTTVHIDLETGIETTKQEMLVTRTFVIGTKSPRKVHHEVTEPVRSFFLNRAFRDLRAIKASEDAKPKH